MTQHQPQHPPMLQAALDEAWLTLDDLCRLARLSPDWVYERVSTGLLVTVQISHGALAPEPIPASSAESWRFDALALQRARRLAALERDFNAVPELAALVADLEDEVARLRLGR